MSPYRAPPIELACPRCKKPLPSLDVATCACGTWLSAFAASEVLTTDERRADPVTRWWRVRAPCPICGDQMILRGTDPGLFQGCDGHGFWIDADTVQHTNLAHGVDYAALDRKRDTDGGCDTERRAREQAAHQRAIREAAEARADELIRFHRLSDLERDEYLLRRIEQLEARNAELTEALARLLRDPCPER